MAFIAIGVVGPWWLPILGHSIPTFHKEWLAVVAFGFAGLCLSPPSEVRPALIRNPAILAAAALLIVLAIQGIVLDGVWRKASLTAFGVAFFGYCLALGREMRLRHQLTGFDALAGCILVAALGSCALAFMQLIGLESRLPFVIAKSGMRLYGNVAQANHFADLLWLGCIAAVYLLIRKRLGLVPTGIAVLTMQAGSVLSGSRTVWLYAVLLAMFGCVLWWRRPDQASRRLAAGLLALVAGYSVLVGGLALSGVLDRVGIVSAEQRFDNASGNESNRQRVWFWHAGIDAALHHPLIGIGAGQLPGHARELALAAPEPPSRAADAHAHNVFIQLAAEQGFPIALFVAACLGVWLVRAARAARTVDAIAALAMIGVILIHANLEHPLAYLYFLSILGLLFGQLEPGLGKPLSPARATPSPAMRVTGFAVLAFAAFAYVQFQTLERAMQPISDQVRAGTAPQLTLDVRSRLNAVPAWSPYRDWAEALALIAVVPTATNANEIADRCERAVAMGPTPYLLARCATAMQVAGRPARASSFANTICRIYADSDSVLAQSMELVERSSPAAADVKSTCVTKVD